MVGQASFVVFDIRMVLIPIVSVFPQAVFICCMLYVFRNKLSDRTKTRLGVIDDTDLFRDEIKKIKNHKIKPKIGDKVFLILLYSLGWWAMSSSLENTTVAYPALRK